MNFVKIALLFFFLWLFGFRIFAQETIFEEKTTLYSSQKSGGFSLHTGGFSLNYRYGKYLTGFTKVIYEIEFSSLDHIKEISTISQFEDDVQGYVFGKMNVFFTLRPNIGFHKVFVPKQSVKGVSISYVAHLGPSLGMAKPVYLNIREKEINTISSFNVVKRRYDPVKHSQGDIYGKASFFNGFSEIKFYPGIFSKLGLQFEYSNQREAIKAVEVGLASDLFFEDIPIMAFTDNSNWFLHIYINLLFGKRELK